MPSQPEAGRTLFGASLLRRVLSDDADRLRKHLQRFDFDRRLIVKNRRLHPDASRLHRSSLQPDDAAYSLRSGE